MRHAGDFRRYGAFVGVYNHHFQSANGNNTATGSKVMDTQQRTPGITQADPLNLAISGGHTRST